jgi:acyl carrier protein
MTEPEIYDALNTIFHEIFADYSIVLSPETTAEHIKGWDSSNHINIIVAVELAFDIKMQTDEIEDLNNVGDLVKAIQRKLH